MKYPTSHSVGVVLGDQIAAKQYYVTSIRGINVGAIQLSMPKLELEQRVRLAPVEELVMIELEHRRKVTVARDLNVNLMIELVSYLSRNIDVFAWKVEIYQG